jgi:secondary thiamine-phosphate synthase enzyme
MKQHEVLLQVKSSGRNEMVDITSKIADALSASEARNGLCTIYIPHTTCGVTINENADPSVKRDILAELEKMVPWQDGYHHAEGNSAAHIKASMFGFSQTIPVVEGRLPLGTWQGIYLCEFDGPRNRTVRISILH